MHFGGKITYILASIVAQYTFVLVINDVRTALSPLISTRRQNIVICYIL